MLLPAHADKEITRADVRDFHSRSNANHHRCHQGTVLDERARSLPEPTLKSGTRDTNLIKNFDDRLGRPVRLSSIASGPIHADGFKAGFRDARPGEPEPDGGPGINLNLRHESFSVARAVTITAAPTVDTVKTESSTTLNEADRQHHADSRTKV